MKGAKVRFIPLVCCYQLTTKLSADREVCKVGLLVAGACTGLTLVAICQLLRAGLYFVTHNKACNVNCTHTKGRNTARECGPSKCLANHWVYRSSQGISMKAVACGGPIGDGIKLSSLFHYSGSSLVGPNYTHQSSASSCDGIAADKLSYSKANARLCRYKRNEKSEQRCQSGARYFHPYIHQSSSRELTQARAYSQKVRE